MSVVRGHGARRLRRRLRCWARGCATQRPAVSKLVGGKVVVTRPVDPNAYEHVARALLYEEEERCEEAIAELKRALNFDRDAPEVHARIAELYLSLDRLDEAEQAVQRVAGPGRDGGRLRGPGPPAPRRDGDQRGDVASLRQAVALTSFTEDAPQAIATYLELADAQLDGAGHRRGARHPARAGRRARPSRPPAHIRLAAVAWALGDHGETERHLRLALQAEPNQLDALLMLAWLLHGRRPHRARRGPASPRRSSARRARSRWRRPTPASWSPSASRGARPTWPTTWPPPAPTTRPSWGASRSSAPPTAPTGRWPWPASGGARPAARRRPGPGSTS